jgi:hypothetical protein
MGNIGMTKEAVFLRRSFTGKMSGQTSSFIPFWKRSMLQPYQFENSISYYISKLHLIVG